MSVLASDRYSFIWWEWVGGHLDDIWQRTGEHLQLTLIAVVIGFALSMVLAVVSLRWRWLYGPIAVFAGFLYTIPALALFVLLSPFTGFTATTAEIALVSYTLLILVRNIVAGVDGIPKAVIEAADGMGYTRAARLLTVDLRLATPTIVAGLRIATVTTVGLVTVAGLIGQGGYGYFITDGLNRNFSTPIVVGAVLSVVMAMILDVLLVLLQRLLTPWTRVAR